MIIVANAFSIAASMLGFILALHTLRKGTPKTAEVRRKRSWQYFAAFILLTAGLSWSAWSLKEQITTLRQQGTFENYPEGLSEVYYPVPYAAPPYLRIQLRDSHHSGGSARIVEQRVDGFKVQLSYSTDLWEWVAVGIPRSPNSSGITTSTRAP